MWLTRLAVAAGIWGVFGAAAQVNAQSMDSAPNVDVRVEAEVGRLDESWNTLCGSFYNSRHVVARNIRIRITGFDASRAVVSTHDHYLVGDIPASGRTYHCAMVAAGAKAYGVTVLSAEWGFSDGASPSFGSGGKPAANTFWVPYPSDHSG
jgi:hypothetical protein